MPTVYDVYPNELIEKTAEQLKKIPEVKPPEWAVFVKTGVHKERPPMELDWWYFRAAAILRSVYRMGPIGVNKLKTKYGGKKRRGHKPAIFKKGSGNIIRKCLQQLEKAGLIKNIEKGKNKGRIMTAKGKSFLDKLAGEIIKSKPKPEAAKKIEIPKKEKKAPAKKEAKPKEAKKQEPKNNEAAPASKEAAPAPAKPAEKKEALK
jgi:small subunit ribosomal protein S19e